MRTITILFFCFVVLFIVSCANFFAYDYSNPHKYATTYREVDSGLELYVQEFEKYYGKKITFKVKLSIFPAYAAEIARCASWKNGRRLVEVDLKFYNSHNGIGKSLTIEQVMMHELGHCVLNRDHNDREYRFKRGEIGRESVMSTHSFDFAELRLYRKYRDYYIKELFKK